MEAINGSKQLADSSVPEIMSSNGKESSKGQHCNICERYYKGDIDEDDRFEESRPALYECLLCRLTLMLIRRQLARNLAKLNNWFATCT